MKVLYGTTNQAKLAAMRQALAAFDLEIIGLRELNQPSPYVDESGKDPLVNAELKARAYYDAFHMPVFSCDSGLFFEDLPNAEQPFTHVRRVNGKELTDAEMTEYYAGLAHKHGGRLIGRYQNAICLVVDEMHVFKSMDESLSTESFILSDVPHERAVEGFPLDRLSKEIKTEEYYYDLPEYDLVESTFEGSKRFFERVLEEVC